MVMSVPATLGAVFIGTCISGVLTGVVCSQVSTYFRRCRSDKIFIKLLVIAVWLLDVSHMVMLIYSSWVWLIVDFGNPDPDLIPPAFVVSVIITAATTVIVHGFFIARVYQLSRNFFVVVPMITLGLLRLISASVTSAELLKYGRASLFFQHVRWSFILGLSTSAALDTWLTCTLLYYMMKSRTGFESMDHVLTKLSLYTIQSGLITTVTIVVSLVFWTQLNKNLVHLALYFTINKLYANSCLAALNARNSIRDRFLRSDEIHMIGPESYR